MSQPHKKFYKQGVMVDVWWGVVEGDGPKAYNWSAYRQLVDMVSEIGLKMQCVMSFHGNGRLRMCVFWEAHLNTSVSHWLSWIMLWLMIRVWSQRRWSLRNLSPLVGFRNRWNPSGHSFHWQGGKQKLRVLEFWRRWGPSLGWTNSNWGRPDKKCWTRNKTLQPLKRHLCRCFFSVFLIFFVCEITQAYKDFMQSFCQEFESDLGSVITEIAVGMGPAGELRYPAYPTMDRRWKFPGIGEFQSYDKYMMAMLRCVLISVPDVSSFDCGKALE